MPDKTPRGLEIEPLRRQALDLWRLLINDYNNSLKEKGRPERYIMAAATTALDGVIECLDAYLALPERKDETPCTESKSPKSLPTT
jgi:hypothetical protein